MITKRISDMKDSRIPCDSYGTMVAQGVMKGITQSNLSAFHNTAGSIYESGINQIKCMIDLAGSPSDYSMKVDVKDEILFKRECLSRKLGYYIMNFRSSDFGADSFWVHWDTSLTTVRLYTNYLKLLKDCRSLGYLKEIIKNHTGFSVTVSSDFVGIIDVQLDELDSTLLCEIQDILNIKLGIDGILDYNNGIVTGSNVASLLETEYVDISSLWSSNVIQIYEEFGIEAARNIMATVLGDVLADYATHTGVPKAFNKNSINPNDKLLLSMGFEKASIDIKTIGRSSNGITDGASGVQSQIMMGCYPPKIGSNSDLFDVIYKI